DDSAATSVKVGYRQASYNEKPHASVSRVGFFYVRRFYMVFLCVRMGRLARAPDSRPVIRAAIGAATVWRRRRIACYTPQTIS
ncbi:MAG: hypothetical protein V4754_01075, partial [Pseudomonadota bacterium]